MENFEGKVKVLVESLDYDFSQFSQKSFIQYLVNLRQRPLILKPMHLLEVSGGYFCCHTTDYIIYDISRTKILQNHTIMHEIGHILLNHSNEHSKIYDLGLALASQPITTFHFRSVSVSPVDHNAVPLVENEMEEREAEYFVRLIVTKILQQKALNTLKGTTVEESLFAKLLSQHG